MWSWVLEGIGLTGAFVVGQKYWQGWGILLGNTVLWDVYAITSHQYGFAVASFFYAPLYSRNLFKWYRNRKQDKAMTTDETERNIESNVLAVIHAYDETAESKLARIWKILGEKA